MLKSLSKVYHRFYELLCGDHPEVYPWHSQWLGAKDLYCDLKRILPSYGGRVLDVGCGTKPYRSLFSHVSQYTGLDITHGEHVDHVITADEKWPVDDESYDVIFLTQVLEHVENLDLTMLETTRVLKKGGVVIASFPFCYNEHGGPYDFRRFSFYGAQKIFSDFEIIEAKRQGGIGSTLGLLFLNWIDVTLGSHLMLKLLRAPLLPFWVLLSALVNLIGWVMDKADKTSAFYSNVNHSGEKELVARF